MKKTGQLPNEVVLCPSLRYVITVNIHVEDKLCNGKSCIIRKVDLDDKGIANTVWVSFSEEEVGKMRRVNFANFYRHDLEKTWVPLRRIIRSFSIGHGPGLTVHRKQFPLVFAAALTIHKAQGNNILSFVSLHLNDALVILGDTFEAVECNFKSHAPVAGLHYTAISRVTTLDKLVIVDSLYEKQISTNQEVHKL